MGEHFILTNRALAKCHWVTFPTYKQRSCFPYLAKQAFIIGSTVMYMCTCIYMCMCIQTRALIVVVLM